MQEMGAMALFGERNTARKFVSTMVVTTLLNFGGTLVGITSESGLFKIVKEEGIGLGTRRILAVTGKEAFEAYREQEDALKAVAAILKEHLKKEVPHKVEGLHKNNCVNFKKNAVS